MIYVFDIDDTILFSIIDNCEYKLVSHDSQMVNKINDLYDKGHSIIIHTGRHWNHLQTTVNQLDHVGVKRHSVICGKPPADFNVDDRSVKPDEFLGR